MSFVVGINLPWIDGQYDHDFGYNMTRVPDIDYEPTPTFSNSRQNFEDYIKDISGMGVKVVRLWLFERFEGLTFSNTGHVLGPTTDMFTNLRDACKIAQTHGVKFYFCLMDTWGVLADELQDSPRGDPRQKYATILNGMVTTKEKRDTFLQAAIDLLSDEVIKDSVWAIDVLNEPDGIQWDYSMFDTNRGNIDTGITFDHLVEYINDACSILKTKTGHKVSCGIRKEVFDKFAEKIKNSVDFFDIHHYDNDGSLPRISHLGKDCIVGECGQGDRFEKNDEKQKIAIKKFFENAKNLGYSGCFVWKYGNKGSDDPLSLINSDGTHRPVVNEIKNSVLGDKDRVISNIDTQLVNQKKRVYENAIEELHQKKKRTLVKIKEWEDNIANTQADAAKKDEKKLKVDIIDDLRTNCASEFTSFENTWETVAKNWKENTKNSDENISTNPDTQHPLPFTKDSKDQNPVLFSKIYEYICQKHPQVIQNLKQCWEKQNESLKFEHYFPHSDWLIDTVSEEEKKSGQKKKQFGNWMTVFALGGIFFIAGLIVFSFICAGGNINCGQESTLVDGNIVTINSNIPLKILESQLMVVFIATIIGPVVAKFVKDKYDIDIEAKQIAMIISDGINAVRMYNKEANALRDESGKLDEISQRKLRNLAFSSLRQNYDLSKYKEITSNVGVQIFEKAIESAVEKEKLEQLPLKKEQMSAIVKQAIDAFPNIVTWKNEDPDLKTKFIEGNIRKLLSNIGIEGIAYSILENELDAESSRRILAAAIADKDGQLSQIQEIQNNPYLKYTSVILSAATDSILKTK